MEGERQAKLITLCLTGWLLLSFPVLSMTSTPKMLGGIPVLFVYVFTTWLFFILATYLITRKS